MSATSEQQTYRWLEPKPYKRTTRQLGVRGRNMTVWNLVAPIVLNGHTAEDVAGDYRLPAEAVHEALEYYQRNRTWIDKETDETGRELGLK